MHPCCRKIDTFEKAHRRIKKSLGVLALQDNYPSASSPFISQGHPQERVVFHTCIQLLSHVQLFATPWTISHQTPLSMEFSRQEYWNRLPFPHFTQGLSYFTSCLAFVFTYQEALSIPLKIYLKKEKKERKYISSPLFSHSSELISLVPSKCTFKLVCFVFFLSPMHW